MLEQKAIQRRESRTKADFIASASPLPTNPVKSCRDISAIDFLALKVRSQGARNKRPWEKDKILHHTQATEPCGAFIVAYPPLHCRRPADNWSEYLKKAKVPLNEFVVSAFRGRKSTHGKNRCFCYLHSSLSSALTSLLLSVFTASCGKFNGKLCFHLRAPSNSAFALMWKIG